MPQKKALHQNKIASKLMRYARKVSQNAYAPYSQFQVGAAVAADNGDIFTGVNVENVSLGLTLCAERTAVAAAISSGVRILTAVAVYSPQAQQPLYPCGACLQVLAEFAEELDIYVECGEHGSYKTSLQTLLTHAFSK